MRICLVVDNPRRDLPGLCLLAAELCRRGAACYLVPMNLARTELSALAPDFVLLNYLRVNNAPLAAALMEAGVQIAVLDTEGGVMSDFEHYAATIPKEQRIRLGVGAFYAWGQAIADYLRSNNWYNDEQVVVTGCPRFDYYTEPWKRVPLSRMSFVRKKYTRPLILIAGNFSLCNPLHGNLEREIDIWVQNGHERHAVIEWQRLNRETLDGMVSLTSYLAQRFPRYTFVFRPHPFENFATYSRLFEQLTNVHVDATGSIDGWLLQCDAVIQRNSTTGIEAGFAGVPSLVPEWLPVAFPIPSVESVSVRCASQEQLAQTLEGFVQGRTPVPSEIKHNLEEITAKWFFRIDGAAHKRLADDILMRLSDRQVKVRLDKCRDIHYYAVTRSRRAQVAMKARRFLRMPLGRRWWQLRTRDSELPWDRSAKYFGVPEVQELMGLISDVLNSESPHKETRFRVQRANNREDYRISYVIGRSILVSKA